MGWTGYYSRSAFSHSTPLEMAPANDATSDRQTAKEEREIIPAAWSYPNPKPAAQKIREYVAFEQGRGVQIEM